MAACLCILQEGVCVFSARKTSGARIVHINKHRCNSNTHEVPSYS